MTSANHASTEHASGHSPGAGQEGGRDESGLGVFKRPAVVVVLGILLLAAIALNGAVQALGLHFKKEPVELSKPLTSIPAILGPWRMFGRDEPYPAEIEHQLGTKDYIARTYFDTRIVPIAEIERAEKLPESRDRNIAAARLAHLYPRGTISVHLAYYTGQADTVAHVPERCMVGGGFDIDPRKTAVVELNVGRSEPLELRYIEFQARQRAGEPKRNVAYMFDVNGKRVSDSTAVRVALQDLFQRKAYYNKTELSVMLDDDTQGAQNMMADFLTYAIDYIDACLPDWEAITAE